MNRRFFLLAAPAIVAAPSLMRVSTLPERLALPDVLWDVDFADNRTFIEECRSEMRIWYRPAGIPTWAHRVVQGDPDGSFTITFSNAGDQAVFGTEPRPMALLQEGT